MSKYKRGTQAQLDAAKNDATLLPFDTVFIYDGIEVKRFKWLNDDVYSVAFVGVDDETWEGSFVDYLYADKLTPAKKPKQKKWQNGTQEDLDFAKDDARLIPKKTFFMSTLYGSIVYRIDSVNNDRDSILMFSTNNVTACFHSSDCLEPIKEE